jgi:hypothetical protein
MMSEYQPTPEEEAYELFFKENEEMLAEAAHTICRKAASEAYKIQLCRSYAYQEFEYDQAMEAMHLAATEITSRDRELLTKHWRFALAAAASIDPDDETPAGHKIDRGDVHWYYRMVSGMIEEILQEKKVAELQKQTAKREPEDLDDPPSSEKQGVLYELKYS